MCGIAGIWGVDEPGEVAGRRVASMLEAMRHRGPDGSGLTRWPGGAAGMVRLALVDLSERGQQPLWSPDGKVAIVFNGEMYNHAEHRERLKRAGFPFKSESDTEVVLALYLERGLRFTDEVRGMFALAILDFRERGLEAPPKLVLARDPFGIKPLYLARRGQTLVFASELRALLHSKLIPAHLDREGLADYLSFGFVLQPRTMLAGITMLPPGTLRVEEPGRATQEHRFWLMPPSVDAGDDFETSALRVRAALEESVRLHAMADTPVGAFLSGGVDSSAIVAMMTRHNSRLRTYTVRFTDARYDESQHAREFAARLGCDHTEVEVGDSEVRELFPRFAATLDQPSKDGFNTWLVSRAAAKDVKGVVSGLGGDEWFAGYPVVRRMKALGTSPLRRLVGRAANAASDVIPGGAWRDQVVRVAARATPMATWAAAHRVFLPGEVARFAGTAEETGAQRLEGALGGRITDSDPVDLACQLDVWAFMGCQLLRDSDVTSMASSLELRVPLVDREIARLARTIAPGQKVSEARLPPAKCVLIEAVKDLLPADIHSRPKRGFSLPFEQWMDGPLKETFDEALEGLSRRGVLGSTFAEVSPYPGRWSLAVLELWCRAMLDDAPSPSASV